MAVAADTMADTPVAVETRNLTKRFDRQFAVSDLDLTIHRGETYGLIGPNGAGKTTLIRMLAAAEDPTIGEIYIDGDRLLRDRKSAHLKQRIGYLPDDFPVYDDLTVWDYLEYFGRLYRLQGSRLRERIYDVLELVQLGHKRKARIVTLSRGMKQRLSLARTIIHEPLLLLLDEPVSGLDPLARMQFRDIIKALREAGMTILISSHVLSDLAELCTSIGIMELGYLVASAPLAEIYDRYSRQQLTLAALGDPDLLEAEFRNSDRVSHWERLALPGRWRVEFAGQDEDCAELLRSLITAGIQVVEFHRDREDLEAIFLKLGHQQSS